jgi:hypothetical protein
MIRDPLNAASGEFYLQIRVTPENDPPVFKSMPPETINVNTQFIYSIRVEDPDPSDMLVYQAPIIPSWMSFYPNSRLIAGIPPSDGLSDYSISISVSDGQITQYQTFNLHVNGVTADIKHESGSIMLYPNPASDYIVIDIQDQSEDILFELFDISGKPVLKKSLCNNCRKVVRFNESELKPGLYIYRLSSHQEILKGRLQINGN